MEPNFSDCAEGSFDQLALNTLEAIEALEGSSPLDISVSLTSVLLGEEDTCANIPPLPYPESNRNHGYPEEYDPTGSDLIDQYGGSCEFHDLWYSQNSTSANEVFDLPTWTPQQDCKLPPAHDLIPHPTYVPQAELSLRHTNRLESHYTPCDITDMRDFRCPMMPLDPMIRGATRFVKRCNKQKKSLRLWEFLLDCLNKERYNPELICWMDEERRVFRFVKPQIIASLWGAHKNHDNMTYEKMSRAMRHYYRKNKPIKHVAGQRLVYQFV